MILGFDPNPLASMVTPFQMTGSSSFRIMVLSFGLEILKKIKLPELSPELFISSIAFLKLPEPELLVLVTKYILEKPSKEIKRKIKKDKYSLIFLRIFKYY
jgi:hypothetical protein